MTDAPPIGWRLARLGEVATLFNGKAGGTGGSWLRAFKTRHVYDGYLRLTDPVFAPDERASAVSKETLLRAGDTLTPNMAHGTIGRVAFVREADENWTVDGQIMVVRPKDTAILGRYIYDWMSRTDSKRQLVDMEKGGAFDELRGQTHIYRSDVATIPILIPPIGEQRKIAGILSSVDDAIEATQAVIDQLQVVQKAMMTELLMRGIPGRHTKFKMTEIGEVPDEWEVVRIGDLLTESAYGTSAKCATDGEGLPVLRIPNVVSGRVTLHDLKYASLSTAEVGPYRLRCGDLLIIRTNGNPSYVGRSAIVPHLDRELLYASYLIRVRVALRRVTPEYLHEALRTEAVRKTMAGAIRTSAGNYNLNTQGIASTVVPLPSLEEQARITEVAQALEERIDAESNLRESLRSTKSALLSVLLTGDVRVTPDAEAAA